MKSFSDAASILRKTHSRNKILKEKYGIINDCLKHLASESNGVPGIEVTERENEDMLVSFVGLEFLFSYSPAFKDESIMGQINFYRVISEDEKELIQAVTFNGNACVDYPVPENQDPVHLDNDISVMTMLLNMLVNALNHNK
jgi:hypothetical protein